MAVKLTYYRPNGEWGIEDVDLTKLPPKVYGALHKLMEHEHRPCDVCPGYDPDCRGCPQNPGGPF